MDAVITAESGFFFCPGQSEDAGRQYNVADNINHMQSKQTPGC